MMSSSYPTSYPQIDHRSLYKRTQLETDSASNGGSNQKIIIADIFSPITDYAYGDKGKHLQQYRQVCGSTEGVIYENFNTTTVKQNSKTTVDKTKSIARRPSSSSSLLVGALTTTKTKIPYPLATIWNKKTSFHSKGKNCCSTVAKSHGSLLMRNSTKSHLTPLNMKPMANETASRVECTHLDSHDNTTTLDSNKTGGTSHRFYSARRKLALITQKPSGDSLLQRSLSLRKNFKYSTKTDSSIENQVAASSCSGAVSSSTEATANVKATVTLKHDVEGSQLEQDTQKTTKSKDNYQGDGLDAKCLNKTMEKQQSPDAMVNGKLTRDCHKMSLNQNGIHTSSAATTPTTTTATATTTPTQNLHSSHHQHSRPLTLATTASNTANATTTGGGVGTVKTPKSPKPLTTSTVSGNGNNPQQQQTQTTRPNGDTSPNTKVLESGGLKPTPKTPPVTPDSPSTYLDDDLDSLYSYTTTSGRSTMSCEHPYVARNGTTFSGRKMKYVVHCSNYAGQVGSDYLTPTQRAQRQIRRLKELLCVARQDLEQKDSELLRLTREVVELRLFKASLSSPDERSASSDAVTVREAVTSQDVSPIVDMVDDGQNKQHSSVSPTRHMHGGHHHHHAASASPTVMLHQASQNAHQHHLNDMQSSFADSGHFEDMTSSSIHSKDSSYAASSHDATHHHHHHHHDSSCPGGSGENASALEQYELQRQELIRMYEQRIEDLVRSQDAVASDIKRSNNDRIEALLQKLAECNTRYADIVPDYEHAKERIRELEKQLEDLQRKLCEHEEKQKQMYLHMYQKGQEAERIARADQALELAHRAPQNKVSINELLHQLQSTQDELENIRTIYRRLLEAQKNRTHVDPEVTLQFLKSAVYYFLTDKENSQGHLQAIESILEFSEAEKQVINKARASK
ncbi:GRIP domain-containing protein quick-to-court isoform X2 [Haematobia irritans]|uniref:GRIP domain-containing protein quick-to-court isoform X2 n=1 Tax=Haematobia irritans TaxID=7368 RepID=UPI003F50CA8B